MVRGRPRKKPSSLELLTRHKKKFEKEQLPTTELYKNTILQELTEDEKAVEVESLNKLAERYQKSGNRYTATRTPRSSLGYLRRLRESLDIVIRFLEVSDDIVRKDEEYG